MKIGEAVGSLLLFFPKIAGAAADDDGEEASPAGGFDGIDDFEEVASSSTFLLEEEELQTLLPSMVELLEAGLPQGLVADAVATPEAADCRRKYR